MMTKLFTCLCTASLKLEIYFLKIQGEMFLVLFQATVFISLALRKCKNDCNITKVIPVQDFSPLKLTEMAQFLIGFLVKAHLLKGRPFESPVTVMLLHKC